MGVTIECNKTGRSCDLGYGGFNRFRNKVAEIYSPTFGEHYRRLDGHLHYLLNAEESKKFFDQYNAKTQEMVDAGLLDDKVAHFCYQPDCDGKIDARCAKAVYSTIKGYDDDIIYGYAGRADGAMFADLKAIFKDCVDNRCGLKWW